MKIKNILGIGALTLANLAVKVKAQDLRESHQKLDVTVDNYKVSNIKNEDGSRSFAIFGTYNVSGSPPARKKNDEVIVYGKCMKTGKPENAFDTCLALETMLETSPLFSNEFTGNVVNPNYADRSLAINLNSKPVPKKVITFSGLFDPKTNNLNANEASIGDAKLKLYK